MKMRERERQAGTPSLYLKRNIQRRLVPFRIPHQTSISRITGPVHGWGIQSVHMHSTVSLRSSSRLPPMVYVAQVDLLFSPPPSFGCRLRTQVARPLHPLP